MKYAGIFAGAIGVKNKTVQRHSLWTANIWWALEDLNF